MRTAKTPRRFPGQPAEEITPRDEFLEHLESKKNPHVLVMEYDGSAHVRVAIAKFAVEELLPGSNMLVAGAYLDDESLVHLTRSLMTITQRRGLLCHL